MRITFYEGLAVVLLLLALLAATLGYAEADILALVGIGFAILDR